MKSTNGRVICLYILVKYCVDSVSKIKSIDMDVQRVLCMKGGDGKDSYARNSLLQKVAMSKVKPILEKSLTELYNGKFPGCLAMADLGCGSGPNTLLLVREVIDIIRQNCQRLKTMPPVFQVFLNDLPSNDFNSIFNALPSFYQKLERESGSEVGQCFVSATVGSFYGRLFPPNSLHFVHSSYSLHWQSEVPEQLVEETEIAALNKWNICLGKNTNKRVAELYSDLFKKDFWAFLRSRSAEVIEGGTMVLTLLGRENETIPSSANQCFNIYELLERCFQEMALENEIEEAKLVSFNLPLYEPTDAEMKGVIQMEGSFRIQHFETFKLNWDPREGSSCNQLSRGKYVAKIIRAVNEPFIASHFGHQILDSLFGRFAEKVEEYEEIGVGEYTNIVVWLRRS